MVVTGTPTTITFSSIPNSYTDLRITFIGSDISGNTFQLLYLMMNGDNAAANYAYSNYLEGFNSSAVSGNQIPTSNGVVVGFISGHGVVTDATSSSDILIPNYSGTTFKKHLQAVTTTLAGGTGAVNQTVVDVRTARWNNTAAVTDIVLTTDGSGFATGTTAILYAAG